MTNENKKSKLRAALEMSTEDTKIARAERTYETEQVHAKHRIDNKKLELKELELSLEEMLDPDKINPQSIYEQYANTLRQIDVMGQKIKYLEIAYEQLFEV